MKEMKWMIYVLTFTAKYVYQRINISLQIVTKTIFLNFPNAIFILLYVCELTKLILTFIIHF